MKERDPAQTALPADLEALSASAGGREGTIWSLEANSDLNANLVRFGVGRGVGEHVNDEADVVFVGVSGSGFVEAGPETVLACDAGVRHCVEALSDAVCLLNIASGG